MPEKGPNGEITYIGPSPDESALLMGAHRNGFTFQERNMDEITLNILGTLKKTNIH